MFTFSGLRALLAIGALGTASLTVSTGPALADGETCDGKPATVVVSSAPDGSFPDVNGTSGDDVIVVTTPDDVTVNGLAGDDTICGGAMTWMTGGAGNDELWSGWFDPDDGRSSDMRGDEGDDVIHGNGNRHFSVGGTGNDIILGGDGGGFMIGGTRLTTRTAPDVPDNDTMVGGAGVDVMVADWGDDTLTGGSGEDHLILGLSSTDTDEGCDVIAATATLRVANGTVTGFGADTFTDFEAYNGGTRKSTLIGTAGPDDLGSGSCGTTHLVGLGGDDRLEGESDGDGKEAGVLSGNRGDDEISFIGPYDIHAGKGDDRISLESSDFIDAFPGADVRGGGGTDWFTIVGFSPGEVTDLDLRRGLKSKFIKRWLPIQGVENARQTAWPGSRLPAATIRITGTAGRNVLVGSPSTKKHRAVLRGLAGNDRLLGDRRVTAYGGPGRDFCQAGQRHGCERG